MPNNVHSNWPVQTRHVKERLSALGLDLAQWFGVDDVNQKLAANDHLPQRGGVGLVIGNSRALWKPFDRWRAGRLRSEHPLDQYVELSVGEVLKPLGPTWLAFSHQVDPAPIPIQRYAAVSGLAQMSPVGLSVHPDFGPWIALRAVALFAAEQLPAASPPANSPCIDCPAPCVAPFQKAMNAKIRTARLFLPVRTSCPVGRDFRYSEEQIEYHYDLGSLEPDSP